MKIHALAFSPDGRLLAVGGMDKSVRLWDVATAKLIHELAGHSFGTYAAAFSPDLHVLATGGNDSKVHLWAIRRPEEGRAPDPPGSE